MRTDRAFALGAAIAAGLTVLVPAGSRGDASPVPLTCPTAYTGDESPDDGLGLSGDPALPKVYGPPGFDRGDALAPRRTPTRAVVCSYAAGPNHDIAPAPNPLTSQWEVPDGLQQVAADLSAVPEADFDGCSQVGGDVTRQLIGLEYDDTAVWVSATDEPNDCIASSNGSFRGSGGVGDLVATAVRDGRWLQPTHGYRSVCGERVADGRPEGRQQLVPGSPMSMGACVADSESGTFLVQEPLRSRLVELLNDLPTRPASGEVRACGDAPRFELMVTYASGAQVTLEAATGDCPSVVTNGDLEATVTPALTVALRAATTHG